MNRSHGEWAIEAHGLIKTFGENRAVDGVDLSVRTGTVYGVLGPNGAGKTTTISMLATLLRPDGGEARIFGHDVVKESQVAILLTTQMLDEADQLADRIAVIDRGRVVAEGTADELKASVGTASLQLGLDDRADTEDALRAIHAVLGVPGTLSPEADRITAPMVDADRVTDLLVALREASIRLTEMSVQKPTLDEVFITITGHGVQAENTRTDA